MKENFILSILADPQKFPLREPRIDSGSWYWNIASPYHDGATQYNAVDITMPGIADRNQPVRPPVMGTVVAGGEGTDTWNTVILRHESVTPNGTIVIWFTKYLHMINVGIHNPDGSITPLAAGMQINTDIIFGGVGSVGSGVDNDHIHLSVHADSTEGMSIDLRKVLVDKYGLMTRAEDAGADERQEAYRDNRNYVVHWDTNINAFITSDQQISGVQNPHLILDRSAQNQVTNVPSTESNQYWIAYHNDPNQRRRVVWKIVAEEGYDDGIARWRDIDNDAMVWDGNDWTLYNLL